MQARYWAATAGLLARVVADATSPQAWCGIGAPSEQNKQDIDTLRASEIAARRAPWIRRQTITIPIHMHGVMDPEVDQDASMVERMQAQFDVMNTVYEPHSIQFTLATMDLVNDTTLANMNTTAFFANKAADTYRTSYLQATRRGGYDELNIWFYSDMQDGVNGVCTLPSSNYPEADVWNDGCHIVAGTMPGGDREGYNVGYTAVHETGHWLGLLHPWGDAEGECDGVGDRVSDTPAQSKPVFGCPTTPQNSCPGEQGVDNADNYMDYADDTCYDSQKFTLGQEIRMHSSYTQLRSTASGSG